MLFRQVDIRYQIDKGEVFEKEHSLETNKHNRVDSNLFSRSLQYVFNEKQIRNPCETRLNYIAYLQKQVQSKSLKTFSWYYLCRE